MSKTPPDPHATTEADFQHNMEKRAAMYCQAVTRAYLRGHTNDSKWESLLGETAHNLATLVLYMKNRRKRASRNAEPQPSQADADVLIVIPDSEGQ